MPLVDYANSDEESENECDEDLNTDKPENGKNPEISSTKSKEPLDSTENESVTLFSALPKPRTHLSFLGDDNKLSKLLLNNKSDKPFGKESIKISVPSVSEFDDTDQPPSKKLKPSAKGVGLFSILPPPKNVSTKETNRTLVPHSVAKKQSTKSVNTVDSVKSVKSVAVTKSVEPEDDEEDTLVGNSFFGLSESNESKKVDSLVAEEIPTNKFLTNNNPVTQNSGTPDRWNQPVPDQYQADGSLVESEEVLENTSGNFIGPEMQPIDNNPLELDEKALQILCGGKKKRQQIPMNIIDLSGEEIMPDSKEWLLKQFTEEKKVGGHSRKKGEGPSSQQRRKHQITYLAYKAKAQELELQNQWANNRMTRRQTQSKYGF